MRVLVTGATGFVGSHLVGRLLEDGHSVRAALRTPGRIPARAEAAVVGEIGPDTDWKPALTGVDAVVHLAARVHQMRDRVEDPLAAFRLVNTEGTLRLAQAAAAAGVGRFIFLSSIKAVGERSLAGAKNSDEPETPYGQSKIEAERGLKEFAAGTPLRVAILRPPLVYGPGVKGNFETLMHACWRRIPLPFGSVRNRRSLVFVGNLADAIARLVSAESIPEGAFAVDDGDPMSTADLIRRIARALGRRPLLLPVPTTLLAGIARLPGLGGPMQRLTESLEVDSAPIRQSLGWEAPFTVEEGFAITAAWYRESRAKGPAQARP